MRKDTKDRKKTSAALRTIGGEDWVQQQLVSVMLRGKSALDEALTEMGRMFAECMMAIDRDERSGPDYQPRSSSVRSAWIGVHWRL